MITRDLRGAIARAGEAAGFRAPADPGLRPTGVPGQYSASIALDRGVRRRETAAVLAAELRAEPWIATAEVTGPGYLTITVTPEALADVARAITAVGTACVTSDALADQTVDAGPPGDPLAAATWEEARAALAAQLTARLAAAAGAAVADRTAPERHRLNHTHRATSPDRGGAPSPRATVAYAGRDAVTFTLARAIPGKPLRIEPEKMARHVLGNPAYAVRYAHARAASGLRWVAASNAADTIGFEEVPRSLLDALSWLPERVAAAARRGRPDEFARYLEDLASITIDVLSTVSRSGRGTAPGIDRPALAAAAHTGLAAGLCLLGVDPPDRL
ncbi:MAG: DALR anticodon-binding domain-containing protein [Trebonia sp.]